MITVRITAEGATEQEVTFGGTCEELLALMTQHGVKLPYASPRSFEKFSVYFATPIPPSFIAGLRSGQPTASVVDHHLNSAGTAVVSNDVFWKPVDAATPRGVDMWLISRPAGVSQKGKYDPADKFFTHWFPNPKFKKEIT